MLQYEERSLFSPEHHQFRHEVRKFIAKELTPNLARWEREGIMERGFWGAAGRAGLLCPGAPEAYGGLGLDYLYNTIVNEEFAYVGTLLGSSLQSDIISEYVLHYGSEAQKRRYIPGMVRGDIISAIAMTEPDAGSDLKRISTSARRDGGTYILNGSKTYISNGQSADVVIVVAKTAPERGAHGMSLFLVDANLDGFKRGRNLDKLGQFAADTSELFFEDVRVGADALLGEENAAFGYLMTELARERIFIAVCAQAAAQRAFDETLAYTKGRPAFMGVLFDLQNTRFALADMKAKLQLGWAHLDWALARHVKGTLTAAEAAAAKLWHTETQWEIVDQALQLHGGAGYMSEYYIARMWRDARAQRIYGGASEVMREVIGRAL